MSVRRGASRWVGPDGVMLGVTRYGGSAPSDVNMREYGFTGDNVLAHARVLVER